MNYILIVITILWVVINLFLLGLYLYIRWLSSKHHMTIYDKRVERIKRKYEKIRKR